MVCRALFEKLTGFKLVKKFPAFSGTWTFITTFTSTRHMSPSWASSIQSTPPHPTSLRSSLILTSHLHLGLPNGLFPSGFPIKTLYMPLLPHMHYMPHPPHSSRFYYPNNIGWGVRSCGSSLCSFLHPPVTLYPLGPNILLSTLFSNTFSLHSSLNVSDHVSHPYETRGKIIVLYIIILKFFFSKLEDKRFCTK